MHQTLPINDPARDALLRRLDTKAAIASAAMEGLIVPAEIRQLLALYANGQLTAAELVSEGLRINARTLQR